MLIARLDGGCWKNPGGPGAAACLISRDGVEIYRNSRLLDSGPRMTNNVAEFEGLKMILQWCLSDDTEEAVHIISDSQVLVNRITGKSRKSPVGSCATIARECVEIGCRLRRKISAEWKSRLHNEECDSMCSDLLRRYMNSSKTPTYMSDDNFRYGDEIR